MRPGLADMTRHLVTSSVRLRLGVHPLAASADGFCFSPRTFGSNIDIIAPATFVSLMIPLAVFFAFQRYFVQGLLAGSVK